MNWLFCLKWDPCERQERHEKGVFRAAHPHTPFLGQSPPPRDLQKLAEVFAGKNLVTVQIQFHLYSEQQRAFGISNICYSTMHQICSNLLYGINLIIMDLDQIWKFLFFGKSYEKRATEPFYMPDTSVGPFKGKWNFCWFQGINQLLYWTT